MYNISEREKKTSARRMHVRSGSFAQNSREKSECGKGTQVARTSEFSWKNELKNISNSRQANGEQQKIQLVCTLQSSLAVDSKLSSNGLQSKSSTCNRWQNEIQRLKVWLAIVGLVNSSAIQHSRRTRVGLDVIVVVLPALFPLIPARHFTRK